MTEQVLSFYESLADHYHLIFEDWDRSIERQAKVLDALLARSFADRPLKILDCACGIGTQALGLASLGHHIVGSDLSPAEVQRARREATNRGLDIPFYIADMTTLASVAECDFDVVAALDNALPHLTPDQLTQAVRTMAAKLKPGGFFLASIRDYDTLLQQRPAMQEPIFFGSEGSRRIVHQVWDWSEQAIYTLHLYITLERANRWKTHHYVTEYRGVTRQEISGALQSAGFEEIAWLMPEDSGYYQPLVLARRP